MATKYDFISSEEKFRLAKVKKDGLWGLWNIDSKTEVVAPTWVREPKFKRHHIIIDTPGGDGLIGEDGKFILRPQYYELKPQTDDRIIAKTFLCFYGLFDGKGNNLLPYIYQEMSYETDECVIARYNHKCGILDIKGNLRLPHEYDVLYFQWPQKVIFAKKDGKCGVFTQELKELIPFEFDNICFCNDFIVVKKGEYTGLYDLDGNEVLATTNYHYIKPVSDKLFIVATDNYKGVVSNDGKEIFYDVYEDIMPIGHGCFKVCKEFKKNKRDSEDKWGIVNSLGQLIVPFEYDYIGKFDGDIVVVLKGGKRGCINKEGKVIIEPEYVIIMHEERDEYIKVCIQERTTKYWGLFDLDGNQLTDIIYDFLHTVKNDDGTIDVEYKGKQGVVML